LGTALTNGNSTLIEQALVQKNRVASGNRGQLSAPADAYKVTDGQIIVLALGPGMHRRWATLMGEEHWLSDPRFADDDSRAEHGEIISARMREWCATRTTEQALAELEEVRLPAAPVLSPQQALDDPHVQAAGFMQPVDYPGLPGPAPVAGTPVKLSKTPGSIRRRAPQLGEHTDEILGELGYDAAAIANFREIKAV